MANIGAIIGLVFQIMGGVPNLIEALKKVVEFLGWCRDQWHRTEATYPDGSVAAKAVKRTDAKKLNFDKAVGEKVLEMFDVTATPLQLEKLRGLVDGAENPKWKTREFRGGKKP